MAERPKGRGAGARGAGARGAGSRGDAEVARLRRRIDLIDRRIVGLLDERAALALDVGRAKRGAGRRAIRDDDREREVLLRVSMARRGPLPAADLLAVYRRVMTAMRRLEAADRRRGAAAGADPGVDPGDAPR